VRIGRIPYINCFPVYGAIDRGIVPLDGELVTGVPTALNAQMAAGALDMSVVSAVEYARDSKRYLLLPELAISCNGPVRSVLLFSHVPAGELGGRRVIVSRSSMTSVALLELQHGVADPFAPGADPALDLTVFDYVVFTPRLDDDDPCVTYRRQLEGMKQAHPAPGTSPAPAP